MKNGSRLFLTIFTLLIGALSFAAFINRQEILDRVALYNYTPSQTVVSLADDTTMTDSTRRVFYVNHPTLSSKQEFSQNCQLTEHSIVLGCYIQNKGIYLLNVNEERLHGVMQVTSAHEVLHAEYDRLSEEERARVDQMTSANFANVKNERIRKTIDQYRSKDPSVVPNELHSILATEVQDLSTDLESYYSKYFSNRKKVVEFSEKYEQTFVDLSNQVKQYDQELQDVKSNIESNQQELEGISKEIDIKKNRLDLLLSQDLTDEYNNSVPDYNATINSYNNLVTVTRQQINKYNQIVEKRNAIATTEQELVEAMNSNIAPKESQ